MALRRATHQLVDRPLVFEDPFALRILGLTADDLSRPGGLHAPRRLSSRGLRAFLVARSRFAEDALQAAMRHTPPMQQYVLLGAGLDTFAYRNATPGLRVFEVDHAETQRWKQGLLQQAGIAVPPGTVFVATDFQEAELLPRVLASGFDPAAPALFAWLGVIPYLTHDAVNATLAAVSAAAPGSLLVLDYHLPRAALPPHEQAELDSLSARVAAAGEPFVTFFEPGEIHALLEAHGWHVREDLHRDTINARYFAGRADGLQCTRSGARLLLAERQTP